MLVGPTAVGKSTIMHEVVNQDAEFSYAKAFTTRPRREGEITTYRHVSGAQAEALRDAAYTYFTHPTTGIIYGTDAMTFNSRYTLLDTLSNAVDAFKSLPFERTITVSVTCDPEEWERRLKQRFPEPSEDRTKRLLEAKQSIEWSLAQADDHHWLVNATGVLGTTAETLRRFVQAQQSFTPERPHLAEKMLESVERLLSYKQKEVSDV